MLDFTSALYLGMGHASDELAPWAQLTTGRPAALEPPPGEAALAARLAALVGCARALVGVSTLHLWWDLFGALARTPAALLVDDGAYPLVRHAAGRLLPLRRFAHHDPDALERALDAVPPGARPVVVADGYCPSCGRGVPLGPYLEAARARGGLLMLDDTQALGILGGRADGRSPYGEGGGGSLVHHGVGGPDVVLVASLAKAFGAPLALLAGDAALVDWLEARSETRLHASPPSAAALRAAEHALDVNEARGDRLRARLGRRVRRLREWTAGAGLLVDGGAFPVVQVRPRRRDALVLHRQLLARGLRGVPTRSREDGAAAVTLLLTAAHSEEQVAVAAETLLQLAA